MRAEVVAIGDELTSGRRLDTNSQWLSQQLAMLGIPVLHHSTVGDDLEAIIAVLSVASQRSDIVVVSGGLGPTADDLTRQALSTLVNRPLVQDDRVLDHIRALFASRGRVMPERNVIQSHFPEGSRPIDNPHGTAPGIHLTIARHEREEAVLFALPGVPAEMTEMWNISVAPAIAERLGPRRRVIRQREIRCFGAGESEIECRLPDLVRRGQDPVVGITASQATITLRVMAEGATLKECNVKIEPTVSTIYRCLGPLVFGEDNEELEDAVARLLADRDHTLATVEWGTAGLVASWLSGVAKNGGCYRGGLVVRDAESLANSLGVHVDTPTVPAGDQSQLVTQMADAVRERFVSHYGLAVGPFPQADRSAVATSLIYVAVTGQGQVVCERFGYAAHPAIQRERSAKQALNLIRLSLLEHRPGNELQD
ncbi:MAG: CinA family nicotinamide mononucleotide deamidase-related protein [Pirellulaceae bacterium]